MTRYQLITHHITHSHDYRLLTLAFSTYVRPLLEFSSQVWSPHYKYLIDKLESVQRFFTGKLSGLKKLSYFSRLKMLGLETLERRRLNYDLVLYYKILHGHSDIVLSFTSGSSVTRGNNFKLAKQTCSIDVRKLFMVIELLMHGIVYTVVSASSINSFKRKLREINLDRFLTIVE